MKRVSLLAGIGIMLVVIIAIQFIKQPAELQQVQDGPDIESGVQDIAVQDGPDVQEGQAGSEVYEEHSESVLHEEVPGDHAEPAPQLAAQGDLTGDGEPESVWVEYVAGAHTTLSTFKITDQNGDRLGEAIEMPNAERVDIIDRKLSITGGIIGSAGAGPWQRAYTDSYTVDGELIKRVDRVFAESPTAYHHLLDGLWAEAHGQVERALQSYLDAASHYEDSYEAYAFEYNGEWVEGGEQPEWEADFELVIQQFAEMRRRLLQELIGHSTAVTANIAATTETIAAACSVAKQDSGYGDDWLPYLNAPAGYMNYKWTSDTICHGIDQLEL